MNGMNGMIMAFNATYHTIETRHWLERLLISLIMVFILFTMITVAVVLIIVSKIIVRKLVIMDIMRIGLTFVVLHTGKWLIILALIFFSISFLYYYAPSKKTNWRFYSPGSTLASLLVTITSLGFSAFINTFGRFNEFFGPISTLMVLLIWLYLNALALLIGFELNVSIKHAQADLIKV
jgi:membrane protein